MENLKSQQNPAEQQGGFERPNSCKTDRNQYELTCEACGRRFDVSEKTFLAINSDIEAELNIPIRCYECDEERDNLSYDA